MTRHYPMSTVSASTWRIVTFCNHIRTQPRVRDTKMHLFHCPEAQVENIASVTSTLTPLGRVGFEAAVGGNMVSNGIPSATYRLKDAGWLACWHQRAFYLELLVCRPTLPTLLKEMPEFSVTDCWAGIWRLEARSPTGPCLFAAVWEPGSKWKNGGPDSGEHLYAKTWDDEQAEVTIGTEDNELLAYRAEHGNYLPNEWCTYFCAETCSSDWRTCAYWQHETHEQLLRTGVPAPVPSLLQGQRCQIHFVVAWADYRERSVVTGLAVDRTASEILMGVDCL
jgi:hypothetical protein